MTDPLSQFYKIYRWVHLDESEAIALEENEDIKLLANTSIQFENNNKKMREYHVDTHPIFSTPIFEKKESVEIKIRPGPLWSLGRINLFSNSIHSPKSVGWGLVGRPNSSQRATDTPKWYMGLSVALFELGSTYHQTNSKKLTKDGWGVSGVIMFQKMKQWQYMDHQKKRKLMIILPW